MTRHWTETALNIVTLLATLYLVIRCAPALLWGN